MNQWKPYIWRIIFTALGLAAAILFMLIGFWKTILILLCCSAGYTIGMHLDKNIPFSIKLPKNIQLPEWLRSWKKR